MGYYTKEDEIGRVYSMYGSKRHKHQILVTDHEKMRSFHTPMHRGEEIIKMSLK